jgi:hypothetical protein
MLVNLSPFVLFYGSLVYFVANWDILWPIGIFYGYLVNFSCFGMLYHEKSGNPGPSFYPNGKCIAAAAF